MFRSPQQAVALILQSSPAQSRLWKTALESQGFRVIGDSPDIDILDSIETLQPEVALIDISQGNFNPFEISRRSATVCPNASIVFTNHKRKDIYPSERSWAQKQKAADLISAPATLETLRATVARIIELSGTPITFNSTALTAGIVKLLRPKQAATRKQSNTTITEFLPIQPLSKAFSPIAGIIRDIASMPDAHASAEVSHDQKPQPVMFRGRPVAPDSATSSAPNTTPAPQPTVTREPQYDNPFPQLFAASPSDPDTPDSPYVVC